MVRGGSTKKTLGFELPTPVDAPRLDLRERSRVSDRSVEPPAATPTRDRFEPTRAAPYLLTRGRGRCGRKLVLMPDEKPLRDLPGYALRVVGSEESGRSHMDPEPRSPSRRDGADIGASSATASCSLP